MIQIITGIIVALFYAYLVFTFFSLTSLILNAIIIAALYFLITKDLKDSSHHKYYLISLFLTALFFIFSATEFIGSIIKWLNNILISEATLAAFLSYAFANIVGFVYEYSGYLKEKRAKN